MVVLGVLLTGAPARAEVSVLTMTPGPHLVERFGHTALRIGWRVYNFGTFAGDDPQIVSKFLGRKIEYWLSVRSYEEHLAAYDNRVITEQVLALDAAEERELLARLEDNARPEHRAYRYDFFLDNCATRVRDAVNRIAGGVVARQGATPGGSSYRRRVEEILEGPPVLGAAVSLLLNGTTDEPTTRWQEAFLPRELQSLLGDTVRADGRPLVRTTRVLVGSRAASVERRSAVARFVDALLLLVVVMPLPLSLLPGPARARRVLRGVGLCLGGAVGGLLGVVLVVSSLTPYACAQANGSLLVLQPSLLLLLVAGVAVLRGRTAGAPVVAGRLAAGGAALLSLGDLVAHALGAGQQQHLGLALLVLLWSAAALAALSSRGLRATAA